MSKFLHSAAATDDDNDGTDDNAKAIAIPQVFSENSQAKKHYPGQFWFTFCGI